MIGNSFQMVYEERPTLLVASHTPPIPVALYVAEGCSTSTIVISVLLSKRGVSRVIACVRFAIPLVVASSRIEMRLLSEMRSVFEYLPRMSVSVGYTAMSGSKAATMSHSFPRIAVLSKPDREMMNEEPKRRGVLRARVPVLVLYRNRIKLRGQYQWITHGI